MNDLPRLCEFTPVEGKLKTEFEDFRVDEIPSYPPSGEGQHLMVHFEKRDLTTRYAMGRLADIAGADRRQSGAAGMKDRHAVTTQWISLDGGNAEALEGYEDEQLKVLSVSPHQGKLRTGHLRGNRFDLRVRGVSEDDVARVLAEGGALAKGVPNFFGQQRFGRDGDNADRAKEWLVEGGRKPRDRFQRRLLLSSLQSAAFNEVLSRRVTAGQVHTTLEGDLYQTQRRGTFCDEDTAACQRRMDEWEISPTGPMFGGEMRWPEREALALEREVEALFGFGDETYKRMGKLGRGTRRMLRIRPENLIFSACEDGFRVAFTLPPGSYATVVMRELLS